MSLDAPCELEFQQNCLSLGSGYLASPHDFVNLDGGRAKAIEDELVDVGAVLVGRNLDVRRRVGRWCFKLQISAGRLAEHCQNVVDGLG